MGRPARVTRDQVLKAAREAFAARGYDGTTLAAIAARLGLSPAALLRHAPTKAALFTAAMNEPPAADRPFPVAFLAEAGVARPREVLEELARALIPFIEAQMSESIACWMYAKSAQDRRTIRLPWNPRAENSPPRRVFALLEGYLRRASRAGTVRVRDPKAAAMAFMGNLNAYVFFHRVLPLVDPPLPLDRYIDTLLDIWSRGAVTTPRKRAS
jgi:TetR/AcrR family transcriptional regulator, mexJK operon transcriptional repressor